MPRLPLFDLHLAKNQHKIEQKPNLYLQHIQILDSDIRVCYLSKQYSDPQKQIEPAS